MRWQVNFGKDKYWTTRPLVPLVRAFIFHLLLAAPPLFIDDEEGTDEGYP